MNYAFIVNILLSNLKRHNAIHAASKCMLRIQSFNRLPLQRGKDIFKTTINEIKKLTFEITLMYILIGRVLKRRESRE